MAECAGMPEVATQVQCWYWPMVWGGLLVPEVGWLADSAPRGMRYRTCLAAVHSDLAAGVRICPSL